MISAVNWGQVVGKIYKAHGKEAGDQLPMRFLPLGVEIVTVSFERAARAAMIKAETGISYADAYAVELALDEPNRIIVTADFDFTPAAHLTAIEFLPAKPHL